MTSEDNINERQSGTPNYSLCSQSCGLVPVCSKPGTIKLSVSVADCSCKGTTLEIPKLCQLTCYPKPVTRPIPIPASSVTPPSESCSCEDEEEDMTLPAPTCESEEEGTHEHKYCSTSCCEHHSKGVQNCFQPSAESCSGSCTNVCSSPLLSEGQKPHIEPRLKDHVPRSVEELKASISGLTGLEKKLPPGNLLGCEYIEYRCQISTSLPCSPTDSQVSFTSCPPPRFGFSLTIEPKDHRYCANPDECKHSKEFCPPPCPPSPEPVCPYSLPEPVCPPTAPEALCPYSIPKPACPPPPPEPVCPPPPPKPVCPRSPPQPVCPPPPPKPVCPRSPPQPVCPPPPPKPVCPRSTPQPVCPPPPPKPVCPRSPPQPVCPPPPKKKSCRPSPPPACPPQLPECPELKPECPPSPCPSPPPCPRPPKPPCAGGCEHCSRGR